MSVRALAEYLDTSERRVTALVRTGHMPPPSYGIGMKSPRWDSAAIDARMAPLETRGGNEDGLSAAIQAIHEASHEAARRRHDKDLRVRPRANGRGGAGQGENHG